MKEFWNERFGQAAYIYGKTPNTFFAEQLIVLPKGKLLLPAEGEGRNAVYAAINGWQVTAFDYSEEGKKKAQNLAQQYEVKIDYRLINASDYQIENTFDVIALVYAHFMGEERKKLFEKLERSLKSGGHLIMEVFGKNQLGRDSGGPKKIELLYSKEEIARLFPNLNFVLLEEAKIDLDEGTFHQGEADVIRVVALKD